MNAIDLLRNMHADTKVRLKVILATTAADQAQQQWQALKPLLDLHEELEDHFVYAPLADEMRPGTPLGDWAAWHDADVAVVKQLITAVADTDPGLPTWQAGIGRVADALAKHVMDEEGQIFGRIEQIWDRSRLEAAGAEMQKRIDGAAHGQSDVPARQAKRTPAQAGASRRRR